MYPGLPPADLPVLTQMEEILISPVHALTQVWQIQGRQYAYRGHVCNFPRDTALFHQRVPLLPEDCEIVILRRSIQNANQPELLEDFRVRKHALASWLQYLDQHHPTFQQRHVQIDWERLHTQFADDENIQHRLRSVDVDTIHEDEGPPETAPAPAPENPLVSGGFVMHKKH